LAIKINMFENATFKLTLIYMSILTLICFFFSYNWYSIATAELDSGLERQKIALTTRPRLNDAREVVDEILLEAAERYEEAKDAVFGRIFATNIIIVSAGTLGSYYLARRTLRPIEKAHQEQVRFTADASHELRTPMSVMKTEIEVALRDKKLSKVDAVELLHSNIEELDKLGSLSDGLLKLAHQDEAEVIVLEPFEIDAIIAKAHSRVEKQAKHKSINVTHELAEAKVLAEFDMLVELLVILLDNAIKYSPEHSNVAIKTKRTKSYVTVSVRDNGAGIRKTDQKFIFERFYRADNSRSSQNNSGHGLGLSIASNIAEAHNTRLNVDSDGINTGATFSFKIKRS